MRAQLRTIRQHWWAVAVIVVAMVLALLVAGYLLVNQRVPLPWQSSYTVNAEFASAQAVVGGQGQQVTVAGVPVGEIRGVRRSDRGTAIVSMRIKRDQLDAVHRDATMALRPRTGLQDMAIDLQPGSRRSPKLPDGGTIPIRQTVPQVQIDEVLSSLDGDSRAYLQQFLAATRTGLDGRGEQIQRLLALSVPTAKQAHRVLSVLRERRSLVRTGVSRVKRISAALGGRDADLVRLIDGAAATLDAVGRRDADVRASLRELPATLDGARTAVGAAASLGSEIRGAAPQLRTALRATGGALPKLDPLLAELPADLRPVQALAVAGQPVLERLDGALTSLKPVLGDLGRTARSLQYVSNVLGYNPAGKEEGYLFWLAWFLHNGNSLLSTQDASGAVWRGQLLVGCASLSGIPGTSALTGILDSLGLCR